MEGGPDIHLSSLWPVLHLLGREFCNISFILSPLCLGMPEGWTYGWEWLSKLSTTPPQALLKFLGTKLFLLAGPRMVVRRWEQGPDWLWISYTPVTLQPPLGQIPLTLCKVSCTLCLPEVLMRMHIAFCMSPFSYSVSHTGKQPFFTQWQKAEQLSLICLIPCVLLAGIFSMCTTSRKWWKV